MTADADTLLHALFTQDPEAARRMAALHPVFEPENARAWNVPEDASLADVARAADLPLDAVLAAARGVVGVPELCGCHSGGKGGCGAKTGDRGHDDEGAGAHVA